MSEKRKLKLKGAARYTVLAIGRKDPVLRNEVIEVDNNVAEKLLKEVVLDRANTEWLIWLDLSGEEEAAVDKEVVAQEEEPKKTRRRRRTSKKGTDEAAVEA